MTGASRGIGAAVADLLADHGATVIGTATSVSGAQLIGDRLALLGGHGRALDVNDTAAVGALVGRLPNTLVRSRFWLIMLASHETIC